MKKDLLTRFVVVIFLSITTLLAFGDMRHSTSSARPASREAELSGLVTIRRDKYGVPHILGQTEEAAAFGQGYATAEDHCLISPMGFRCECKSYPRPVNCSLRRGKRWA